MTIISEVGWQLVRQQMGESVYGEGGCNGEAYRFPRKIVGQAFQEFFLIVYNHQSIHSPTLLHYLGENVKN